MFFQYQFPHLDWAKKRDDDRSPFSLGAGENLLKAIGQSFEERAPRALNVDGMIFYGQKVTGKALLDIPLGFFSATSKPPLAGISIPLRLFSGGTTQQARMV